LIIAGWLALEWIEGNPIRVSLNQRLVVLEDAGAKFEEDESLKILMDRIGKSIGRLHETGVIHGDLTTSNMMLQQESQSSTDLSGDVYLIDFGLASQSVQEEDRAVDLYVLERAWISTHPQAESLFKLVLDAYRKSFQGGKIVLKRLEDVRMRGRKKSMIG
jgi:TP53 regulating kinase-like protein